MEKTIKIPEGYEARIEDNKVILEPKESEDERIRKQLLNWFKDCHWNSIDEDKTPLKREDIITWLEKQGSQKPANSAKTCKDEQKPAWSEEDEKMYERCLSYAHHNIPVRQKGGYMDLKKEDDKEIIGWLKSLKERYTWKPSEEQMAILWDVIGNLKHDNYKFVCVLQELYNDLRKLKG